MIRRLLRECFLCEGRKGELCVDKLKVDDRFIQSNREAWWSSALSVGYFVLWYGFAYGLGSGLVADYSYIWGLPAWFVLSCFFSAPLFCLGTALVIRKFFVEVPLDGWLDE